MRNIFNKTSFKITQEPHLTSKTNKTTQTENHNKMLNDNVLQHIKEHT